MIEHMFESTPIALVSLTVPEGPAWDEFVAFTGLAGLVPLTRELGVPCAARPPTDAASDAVGTGPDVPDLGEAALGRIADSGRAEAMAYGRQQREVAAFVHARLADPDVARSRTPNQIVDAAAQEIALATRMSPGTAAGRTNEAMALADHLPRTLDALCEGRISPAAAKVIVRETADLEPAQRRAIDEALVGLAEEHSPKKLAHEVRREILRVDPEAVRKSRERETRQRRVELKTTVHGMAWLSAYIDAGTAARIHGIIESHGAALKLTDEAGRTNDQLRADAFVDSFLNPTSGPRPQTKVHVHVTVPAGTALGLGDEPGDLAGYGPIPVDLTRALIADGTWRRILTDPSSGQVLDYGTTWYRPPKVLVQRIVARDQTCRFPGCVRPAHRCEIDHCKPFRADGSGGSTCEHNLAALCSRHHRVKHMPGWRTELRPDGTLIWTTPTGRTFQSRPRFTARLRT